MSRATKGRVTSSVTAVAALLLAVSALGACGGDPDHHILKNEEGLDINMMGFWNNVVATSGKKTGHYCFIGDLGVSIFMGMKHVSFDFEATNSTQLPNGTWINNIDLVVKKSDLPEIPVGTPMYGTAFVWSDNVNFSIAIDRSLPYPRSGNDYPSGALPMLRAFRK